MAESLKDRCRKIINQQKLSAETARLFLEDSRDKALRADTVRRVIAEMASPEKTPAWLEKRFVEAALRESDGMLARLLMEEILVLDEMDTPDERVLLQYMRLARVVMKTADDALQNGAAPAHDDARLDLFAADAAFEVLMKLDARKFMEMLAGRQCFGEPDPDILRQLQIEIHALLPAIAKRARHPERYGFTPEDAVSLLSTSSLLEQKLQLHMPALASLAEMIMDALKERKAGMKTRKNRHLTSALRSYFALENRLIRRSKRVFAPAEEPFPDAVDERAERLAKRAAQFAVIETTPDSILRGVVRLEISGAFSEQSGAASDLVQSIMLGEKAAFASEEELQAVKAGLPEPALRKKQAKPGKGRGSRLEQAMARILALRELALTGGPVALLHHAQAAAANPEALADYEFSLCYSLLVAAGVECEAPEYLELALQMESRPEAQRVVTSPEGARFAFWRTRRFFATTDDKDALARVMMAFAQYFPSDADASVADYYAENENRRLRTIFGRRTPSPEAVRTLEAKLLRFQLEEAQARRLPPAGGEKAADAALRTLAERFEADLKGFMPEERGLEWWTAQVFAQLSLAKLTHPKRDAAQFCMRYAALQTACEQVYFAVDKTARLLTPAVAEAQAIYQATSDVLDRAGFKLDFLPWPAGFDLPWFPELEKRLGRIIRHVCLHEAFSVIEVADARDPDLIHLVTTCMSTTFFKRSPGIDHEYFITISKKDADPAPAPDEGIQAAIPAAAPLSKLEFSAMLLLFSVYHSSVMAPDGEFQDDVIVTHRAEADALGSAHPAAAAKIEDYLHDASLLPLVPHLPYKAVVACDFPEVRRVEPFQYGPGRTMTLTPCLPLYAEELQFAADYSLRSLIERCGIETFTPVRQSRENVMASFYEGELISREKLRNLLPEGVEDKSCFVEARILQEGAPIDRCIHAKSATGEEMWAFRSAASDTDENLVKPDAWRKSKLSTICNYDAAIRPILSAPSGTAFMRGPNGLFVRDTAYEAFMAAILKAEIENGGPAGFSLTEAQVREAFEAAAEASFAMQDENEGDAIEDDPLEESPDESLGGLWAPLGGLFGGGEDSGGRRDN